jgi:hypothetical protein
MLKQTHSVTHVTPLRPTCKRSPPPLPRTRTQSPIPPGAPRPIANGPRPPAPPYLRPSAQSVDQPPPNSRRSLCLSASAGHGKAAGRARVVALLPLPICAIGAICGSSPPYFVPFSVPLCLCGCLSPPFPANPAHSPPPRAHSPRISATMNPRIALRPLCASVPLWLPFPAFRVLHSAFSTQHSAPANRLPRPLKTLATFRRLPTHIGHSRIKTRPAQRPPKIANRGVRAWQPWPPSVSRQRRGPASLRRPGLRSLSAERGKLDRCVFGNPSLALRARIRGPALALRARMPRRTRRSDATRARGCSSSGKCP